MGRGRCRPLPPQAPSSLPVASALPVFSQCFSASSKAWPERKGYCGSCILANPLPPPSSFNNNGVARGAEVGLGLSGLESGERAWGVKGLELRKGTACWPPPDAILSSMHRQQPSRPESRLVHEQQVLRPGSSGAGGSSCPWCSCASGAGLRVAGCIQLVRVLQTDKALDLQ